MWNLLLGVNLTRTFLVTRTALPALPVTGNGVLVNFSSTAAAFGHTRPELIDAFFAHTGLELDPEPP